MRHVRRRIHRRDGHSLPQASRTLFFSYEACRRTLFPSYEVSFNALLSGVRNGAPPSWCCSEEDSAKLHFFFKA
jgi:hypothetical protein